MKEVSNGEEQEEQESQEIKKRKKSKAKKKCEKWYFFDIVGEERAILRGSRSISDKRFKILSRGRQASAASAVAIVYAQLFEPRSWQQSFVDRVLEYGDRLYRVSRALNRLDDATYMTTCLLQQEFFVGDYKCKICTEPAAVYGNLLSEAVGAPDLTQGLRSFLRPRNFGVLTSQGISVAIWQHPEQGYFLFNPTASDELGRRNPQGFASLVRSNDADGVFENFMEIVNAKFDSRYCIDKIILLSVKPIGCAKFQNKSTSDMVVDEKVLRSLQPVDLDDSEQDCTKPAPKSGKIDKSEGQPVVKKIPLTIEMTNFALESRFAADRPLIDQHLRDEKYSYDEVRTNVPTTFSELPNDLAILHGWTYETGEPYKAKGAQTAASCVMAIGMKKLRPVRTWLRTTLDEILVLADALYAEIKTDKPNIKHMTALDLNDARIKIDEKKLIVDVDLLTIVGTIVSKVPTVLNFKQGLEEFFLNNNDGVVECSAMSVSVWTQEDYFYQFDPRSCDISGHRLVEQTQGKKGKDEGTSTERKVIGKCCVIRFPDLAALTGHFLENLDPSKSNDRFTIRRIEVVDDIPGMRSWNSFKPAIIGKCWILRGSINANNDSFSDHSRGVQGLAMPVLALLTAKTIAPSNWSREDIDDLIRQGDAYYTWCIPPATESDSEERSLVLKNLKKYVYYKKCKATIEVKESCVAGNLPNLDHGIADFFEMHQFGILEANKLYFAIWKTEEELKDKSKEVAYYLFHDKPSEKFLKEIQSDSNRFDSSACALRFLDLKEIVEMLNEEWTFDEEDENKEYFIHEVKVASISEPMTDEEIQRDKATPIKPDLHAYTAQGESAAFLSGSFNQANEFLFKKETRDKQQAANALVTLAMTKIFDPLLWRSEILDDILQMGDKLTEGNAKNLSGMYEEDAGENPRDFLLPSEISREFYLGINRISVDVEEEVAVGKLNELSKNLEDFYSVKRMGIFRQDETILPIWRDENIYFAMDPKGNKNGNATISWYIDMQTLAESLIECAGKDEGDFIIDGVSIDNKYEESEKPSEDFITDVNWYNFSKVSDGIWKIDCDLHPTDEMFQEENRGKQSASICLMAIIFSKVYEPRHWSKEILDEIVITGNKLHTSSAERLGRNDILKANEIVDEFFISSRRIHLSLQDCVQSGRIISENPKISDIMNGVARFFENFTAGFLSLLEKINLAIWTFENHYYCFNPGDSLTRFENVTLLGEQLKTYGEADVEFEISSIDIVDWNKLPPWKFDPSPAVKPSNLPPLNAYYRLPGRARAILRGSTHQASQIFPECVRGRQTSANCVISLAMAVIKNPTTWTRKTLDEIITIGVDLHRESLKSNVTKTTLKPKDIVRIFHIGVNILAADIQTASVKGIVANPPPEPDLGDKKGKKATKRKSGGAKDKKGKTKRTPPPPAPPVLLEEGLNKFFENNNAGILVTGRFMVAIWKDSGVYFMYDPRPRNAEGLKSDDDSEGVSCVVWFACIEPLFALISSNINDDEKFANFEICRVVVKTIHIEPLPTPASYKAINEGSSNSGAAECEGRKASKSKEKLMNVDLETCFEQVEKEVSIVLGTKHSSDRQFCVENRGFQSSAIASVAVVVSALHAPSTWTPELIDAILKYGDTLHTECARLAKPGSRNLSPSELLDVFIVGDVRAHVRYHTNLMAGITLEHDLSSALSLFFGNHSHGIFHTVNYAVPIVQHWGKFYFLDPTERNKNGKGAFEGTSCFFKIESTKKLANVILKICAFKEPTVYTLNGIEILDLHFFTR